jgi:hypothetical protein
MPTDAVARVPAYYRGQIAKSGRQTYVVGMSADLGNDDKSSSDSGDSLVGCEVFAEIPVQEEIGKPADAQEG